MPLLPLMVCSGLDRSWFDMSIDVKKDWWKTLFDDIYLITDSRSVGDESITRREVDLICELLSLNSQHRILDLCGGQGRHTFEFCSQGI